MSEVLDRVGDKWSVLVVVTLGDGPNGRSRGRGVTIMMTCARWQWRMPGQYLFPTAQHVAGLLLRGKKDDGCRGRRPDGENKSGANPLTQATLLFRVLCLSPQYPYPPYPGQIQRPYLQKQPLP